jgi:hypothetical protein
MGRWLVVFALVGCGEAPGPVNDASDSESRGETDAGASSGDPAGTDAAGSTSGASVSEATSSDRGTTSADSATSTGESDTQGGVGPVELYRGPVDGTVPGWTHDDPRPLVMMGRQADEWVATLARIDASGALSQNTAEEIIVWGFAVDPPVVYDGPVGGTLDGWSPGAPEPVVAMGYRESDDSWFATLLSIAPDGSIGDNVADRIVVWGWSGAEPSAPMLAYTGAVGGQLDAWNARAPDPIVALGTPGFEVWLATLVRIAPDGTLSDNTATEIRIWRW